MNHSKRYKNDKNDKERQSRQVAINPLCDNFATLVFIENTSKRSAYR